MSKNKDLVIAASAGRKLAKHGTDGDFLKIFFNSIINGCKEEQKDPEAFCRKLVINLKLKIYGRQQPS